VELEFTAEQDELRASVRGFLAKACPMTLVREVVEKGTGAGDLWAGQVGLDWPGLTVPEACAGIGLGYVELAVLAEELGRVVAPGPLLATVSQFVPMVREAGSPDQRARWLEAVARGEVTGTVAVAEEAGSWSPSAVVATATADVAGWRLSGTKHWVVDGSTASELAMVVRLADTGAVAVVVVPGEAVTASPVRALDGSRNIASVTVDGVVVGPDRLLAGGLAQVERALEEATVALALETVGTCQSIFDIALQYAKDRQQFGVPIGSFQAMKHKFVDMLIALEKARAVAYFAAAAIAEEDARRTLACAMAKAAAGDCQRLLAQEGIQCLGGIGYTWEHDMHLYVKRAKANGALFGDTRFHQAKVAELIGL
jgi:alkylation response protein AidB-like acyl-CoA dehydrogenase